MTSRHKMASFKKEVTPLLELVTNDIYLESIWLQTMSMLEDVAAEFILSNVTDATPTEALRNIIEHVKDEQRHARLLNEMRPHTFYPQNIYYEIENQWKIIGHEFIMGFFNSPLLREANHRHAAYVHGAQTIERFPFRIYSLYLSMTKLTKVQEILPGIIADENEHIELGKNMYAQLAPNERMPLTKLYRLEEELCLMMLKRMNLCLRQCLNLYQPNFTSLLETKCAQDNQFEIAWNYAMSVGEKYFSLEREYHLKSANTLLRAVFRGDTTYRELEKSLSNTLNKYILKALEAGLSKEVIQNRFDRHYQNMIYHTNCIPLHYAYFRILEDHPTNDLKINELQLEEILWSELILEISQAEQHENGICISRA